MSETRPWGRDLGLGSGTADAGFTREGLARLRVKRRVRTKISLAYRVPCKHSPRLPFPNAPLDHFGFSFIQGGVQKASRSAYCRHRRDPRLANLK